MEGEKENEGGGRKEGKGEKRKEKRFLWGSVQGAEGDRCVSARRWAEMRIWWWK